MSKRAPIWLLSSLLVLLAACAASTTEPPPPYKPYSLNAEEAEAYAGATDAETLAAQGLPSLIPDAGALLGVAFKFLGNNDELSWQHRMAPGSYTVRVTARAELYKGAPELTLSVGEQEVTKTFEDESYQTLDYGVIKVKTGERVSVRFSNDKWEGSSEKDRNVILSHLELDTIEGGEDPAPEPGEPAEEPDEDSSEEPGENAPSAPSSGRIISTAYKPYDGELVNPERGFHDIEWVTNHPGYTASTDFSNVRRQGYSLIRVHIGLDEFKSGPMSGARLGEIRAAFRNVREAGLKALPIVSYVFPLDKTSSRDDAPLSVVNTHLEQLRPVFEEYKDVIALFMGGFIGPWGEWHSSSNNLHNEPGLSQVYNKFLDVIPDDRILMVRYVDQLRRLPGEKVSDSVAHNGSKAARTGLKNMCFLVDNTDGGTYWGEGDKNYLAELSKFIPVGGEACAGSSTYTPGSETRYDCDEAQEELERYHWSFLSPNDILFERWEDQGCLDTIGNRLGYRLELKTSSLQQQLRPGGTMAVRFVVNNTGYAAPFNPRGLAVVLKNQRTGASYSMSILQERSSTLDPRRWYREAGDITVTVSPTVPSNVPAGTYDVYLSLHDPESSLSNRPAYSIRLANQNVWDEATGLNLLAKGVVVR
jgi:hypothetical protein